jgi:Putative transposase
VRQAVLAQYAGHKSWSVQLVNGLTEQAPDWPKAVLAYLSRYTHRVAISNRRLIAFDQHGVTFRYKDYCADGRARYKPMTLAPMSSSAASTAPSGPVAVCASRSTAGRSKTGLISFKLMAFPIGRSSLLSRWRRARRSVTECGRYRESDRCERALGSVPV